MSTIQERARELARKLVGCMDTKGSPGAHPNIWAAGEDIAAFAASELERAGVDDMREALAFYADARRYDYDETCCPCFDNPGREKHGEDILSDGGQRARALIKELRHDKG